MPKKNMGHPTGTDPAKEARREYQRLYYLAHKEKAKEYQRVYSLTHKKRFLPKGKKAKCTRPATQEVLTVVDIIDPTVPPEKVNKYLDDIFKGRRVLTK